MIHLALVIVSFVVVLWAAAVVLNVCMLLLVGTGLGLGALAGAVKRWAERHVRVIAVAVAFAWWLGMLPNLGVVPATVIVLSAVLAAWFVLAFRRQSLTLMKPQPIIEPRPHIQFLGSVTGALGTPSPDVAGTKASGLVATLAGERGLLEVHLRHDEKTGHDHYTVILGPGPNGHCAKEYLIGRGRLDSSAPPSSFLKKLLGGEAA